MNDDLLKQVLEAQAGLAKELAATRDLLFLLMNYLRAAMPSTFGELTRDLQATLKREELDIDPVFAAHARELLAAMAPPFEGLPIRSVQLPHPRPADPTSARAAFRLIPGGLAGDA
ncbi:MAG: hypothetical protein WAQ08_15935 [Aquabacterium sp.]|uniref:hypothetical protein n=1 Tax=Aquabacterium sp. TaxID=1872578 RepID=UPI003BAFBA91